jgi:AmmeMemoRadiSam system protein A
MLNEGIISEILISKDPKVTVQVGSKTTQYNMATDAEIKVDNTVSTIYDLRLGQKAEIELDNSIIVGIDAEKKIEALQVKGVISTVNLSLGVITLKSEEDSYVRLARQSLETYVRGKKHLNKPIDLESDLSDSKAGVFVSLKMNGRLRGCIGTTQPRTASIADEIIQNAVSAGTKDPRFPPVEEHELPWLVYSVDVLAEPEPIDSVSQLDVKRYGVIVTSGYKCGLLLPNLESVDTPEQQVSIAMRKGNIRKDEKYSLERFEVVRHK